MSKSISLLSALLCTFIWGTTFIAQDTGMDDIGPFTFNAVRFFVGFLAMNMATMPLWNIEGLIFFAILNAVLIGHKKSSKSRQVSTDNRELLNAN